MNRIKSIAFLAVLFFTYCSRWEGASDITEEVEGAYKYKYPTGQVEVLDIKNNHRFNQKIFANERDYLTNATPLYNNDSTWKVRGKEIVLAYWIAISLFGATPDSILAKPEYYGGFDVTWFAPTDNSKAQINVYMENGYVLEKIDK
jgi:hypothetical protein